jgi:hypothetical protein
VIFRAGFYAGLYRPDSALIKAARQRAPRNDSKPGAAESRFGPGAGHPRLSAGALAGAKFDLAGEVVEFLAGAYPDGLLAKCLGGWVPLHGAVLFRRLENARRLIELCPDALERWRTFRASCRCTRQF